MDWLSQQYSSATQWVGNTASNAATAVSNGAGVAWDATKSGASAAWDATKSGASTAWDATKSGASATWDATKSVANSAANGGAAVQSGYQAIQATVQAKLGLSGADVPMSAKPGKIDYASFGSWPTVEDVKKANKPITVTLPFERGAQGAGTAATTATGPGGTLQTPDPSFVYLDVGRWGGTRSSPKRDFGIVCGGMAVICSFPKGSAGSYTSYGGAAQVENLPNKENGFINALLKALNGGLGTPEVRHFMNAKAPLPQTVDRIYVILGDLHLPTVTDLKPGAPPPEPPEQKELEGKRYGRARRSDAFKGEDVMSDSDAALWHERYTKAEIFQEAGADLETLVGLLDAADIGIPVWLLQLGDMFDLWLGFDCFLKSDPPKGSKKTGDDGQVELTDTPVRPDPVPLPVVAAPGVVVPVSVQLPQSTTPNPTTAHQFIEKWVNHTLLNTTQGASVQKFLKYKLTSTKTRMFLHGNHDNYLDKYAPSFLSSMSGPLPSIFYDPHALLYACHGHQFDKFNRDGATVGNFTTQAAFWGGQAARALEKYVDSRDDTVKGVVSLFRKSSAQPFRIFAMGHTHAALLVEIVIKMDPEPEPVDYTPMMMGP